MTDPITRLNAALEGRYAIERELGEGGMATVYLADDLKHQRKVALKVLKPELAAVVGAERFLAEITTTANLTHPHILPLHDSGEADGFLFYVMPHIQGESLRERIDREKQLGVDDAVAITQKVAGALDYAHENGVVHRDIKPGNILLSAQGEPLVADFGIALAVGPGGRRSHHRDGTQPRHPALHEPRASNRGQRRGPPVGCLRTRLRPVRDARWAATLLGNYRPGGTGQDSDRGCTVNHERATDRATSRRPCTRQVIGEAARRPIHERVGVCLGARGPELHL